MTREEAIKQIESLFEHCEAVMTSDEPVWSQDCEALKVALFALRGPTREQVEKAWRGCDLCLDDSWQRNLMIPKRFDHTSMLSAELAQFCPGCGRPLTDEAVETIMKRMEEMRND